MMKKYIAVIIFFTIAFSAYADYYVAPNGKDTNSGTIGEPFATLLHARDAVRKLKDSGGLKEPLTIFVRGGVYPLEQTLTLTAEDSGTPDTPIVYRAYQDEKPVLLGAKAISGWTPYQGQILKADVASQGFKDIRFSILVFNGQRQEPARYPNRDGHSLNGGTWAFVEGTRISMYADTPDDSGYHEQNKHLDYWQRNIPRLTRSLNVKAEDVHRWSHPEDGQVSVFPRLNWSHYLLDIESFDPNQSLLKLGPGCFYEIRPGDRYFVRGLFEELDTPGEWYLDPRTATLYFWPPEPIQDKLVYVSAIKNLIDMNRCEHVTFRGFTMEGCEGTAVTLNDCGDCIIAANTIRNVGNYEGNAVTVLKGRSIGIVGNDIYDIGAFGINLSGGDINSLTLSGNHVENNSIHHIGMVGRGAKAIEITGAGHRIAHNLIHHVPQSGIFIWGAKHTIEYNRMRYTCLEGEDTGAIGGGAIDWLGWQGMIIRYNYISDTIGFGYDPQAKAWRSPYFTWALYPDWAASGMQIYGNILVRAPLGLFHLHCGRDNVIENNILVDGTAHQAYWSGWNIYTGYWSTMVEGWLKNYQTASQFPAWQKMPALKDPRTIPLKDGTLMYGNVFRHNIISYRDPNALAISARQFPGKNTIDNNLIFHHGLPLATGQAALKKEVGPNLVSNPGLEDSTAGQWPKEWSVISQNDPHFQAHVVNDQAHDGKNSLMIDTHQPTPEDKIKKNIYIYLGSTIPYIPGKAYRLSVWLKGQAKSETAELNSYLWYSQKTIAVTDAWQQFDFTFKIPLHGQKNAIPTDLNMKTFTCQLVLPYPAGKFWIDDVSVKEAEVEDEWTSWQALGFDSNSIIADPLFVDPIHDDYRLRPDSPALKQGFKPIPMDKIGPYQDPLRASWPIRQAAGD